MEVESTVLRAGQSVTVAAQLVMVATSVLYRVIVAGEPAGVVTGAEETTAEETAGAEEPGRTMVTVVPTA